MRLRVGGTGLCDSARPRLQCLRVLVFLTISESVPALVGRIMRTALYLHACLLLFASATACAVEEAGAGLVPGDPPRANAAIASRRASLELLAALWRSDAAAITAWHAERAEGIDSAPTARARIKARLTQDYAAEIALATLAALLRESARSAEGPTGLGDTAAELISAIDRFATAASEEKGNAFAEFESAHRRFAALALSGVGGQPALAIDSVLAIEDLQANLAPGVASVVYTAEPDGNLGATIFTHDGIRHLRLGALQQITVLVDEARAAIVNLDSLDALDQL